MSEEISRVVGGIQALLLISVLACFVLYWQARKERKKEVKPPSGPPEEK